MAVEDLSLEIEIARPMSDETLQNILSLALACTGADDAEAERVRKRIMAAAQRALCEGSGRCHIAMRLTADGIDLVVSSSEGPVWNIVHAVS